MRMYDVIAHKRDGLELTPEELNFFVAGYVNGTIADYQAAALAMAIYLRGMTARETSWLTWEMAASGEMVDLSSLPGVKVDKHSTGGVGDKTTLAVAPLVASCGVTVAKMSGRGLGHTGGTLDKLEAIPGLSVQQSPEQFLSIVRQCGCAVVGQTGNLVPADKKLYALRDVTATVSSIPLIASSIMSKKIAAGPECILLDVKCGSGAFMKTVEDAIALAEAMVAIGEQNGRRTVALVTDMDRPLGAKVGNALEVQEASEVLRGTAPADITEVCVELAANLLAMAGKGSLAQCRDLAHRQIENGEAFARLVRMVELQGGDPRCLTDYRLFAQPGATGILRAPQAGWIAHMDTERVGVASAELGAGRERIEDAIDPAAGLVLARKTGDWVDEGDVLATLYATSEDHLHEGKAQLAQAYSFAAEQPLATPHFFARVSTAGVERLA